MAEAEPASRVRYLAEMRAGVLAGTGLLLGLISLGCGKPAREPEVSVPAPPPGFGARREGAFQAYIEAAEIAEREVPTMLGRVSFTPGQRRQVLVKLASALRLIERADSERFFFAYEPPAIGQPMPWRSAWRMLGRAMAWQIEEDLSAGRREQAIRRLALLTTLGARLAQGDAADLSLGLTMIDDGRRAIRPALATLGAGELGLLAERIAARMQVLESVKSTAANERLRMQASIAELADLAKKNDPKAFRAKLDHFGPELGRFLSRLEAGALQQLFVRLQTAADAEASRFDRQANTPPGERDQAERRAFRLNGEQLAAQLLLGTVDPALALRDRTLARTRLLILTAELLRGLKAGKGLPKDLPAVDPQLTIDPYSGKAFVYESDGRDFRLYSVGADLRDDGGLTDPGGLAPDLTLEPDEG